MLTQKGVGHKSSSQQVSAVESLSVVFSRYQVCMSLNVDIYYVYSMLYIEGIFLVCISVILYIFLPIPAQLQIQILASSPILKNSVTT